MTTYTTPHFATGLPDRTVRTESGNRARPATAATYRTAGVSNEAAVLADGPTPDWQPSAAKGVPKAAIGALGAALVGGVALAIVLMAPSNKVTKVAQPDPVAQVAAQNAATAKSVESTDASVNEMEKNAPAAGDAAAAAATQQAAPTAPAAVPAPVQAVIPDAPPVANAPVARVPKHAPAPVAAPKATPHPVQSAPAVTPDATPTPVVTPPADVQAPAMQQTPDTSTVTPSVPVQPTPDTPAPTPAPAQ